MNTTEIEALKIRMRKLDAGPAERRADHPRAPLPLLLPGAVHDFETHQRFLDAARRARAEAIARLLRAAASAIGRGARALVVPGAARPHHARTAHGTA